MSAGAGERQARCVASEFELLTSTAIVNFELEKVEVVVLEVGMFDRLDAKLACQCARLG